MMIVRPASLLLPALLACACASASAGSSPAPADPASASENAPENADDSAATADRGLSPETPAGDRLVSLLDFLADWSGDSAEAEAFVNATLAAEFRDRFPMDDHIGFLTSTADNAPQLKVLQIISSEDTELHGYLQSTKNGRWFEVMLEVDASAPHPITNIVLRPSRAPLPAETLALIDGELNHDSIVALVTIISEMMLADYVDPGIAEAASRSVLEAASSGEYDDSESREAFAQRLTEDLQAIAHDRHLRVRAVDPSPKPEGADAQAPARPKGEPHGFVEAKILDGNVGYVDLRFFAGPEIAKEGADPAMKTVEGADALIFDMRHNGGGDPRGVQYLSSFLFDEPTHLNSLYWREGDRTEEFWTLDEVGGVKRPDVPVYVLTSSYTFSGAEEFTYNLQMLRRATIVGETTRGGANPGRFETLGANYSLFLPVGKAINPISGTNWEGAGVKPDVLSKADNALGKALKLARKAARKRRS